MLNRLAKAAEEEVVSWVDLPDVVDWPEVVRAVLRELRNPPHEMTLGWAVKSPAFRGTVAAHSHAKEVWQAMIDTILNEKTDADD